MANLQSVSGIYGRTLTFGAVHAPADLENRETLCATGAAAADTVITAKPVDCKHCLKLLAEKEGHVTKIVVKKSVNANGNGTPVKAAEPKNKLEAVVKKAFGEFTKEVPKRHTCPKCEKTRDTVKGFGFRLMNGPDVQAGKAEPRFRIQAQCKKCRSGWSKK